jgi:hypothetical protein
MSDLQPPSDTSQAAANHPIGSPRHFVLACIGLLSLLADEMPALLERSVQRGSSVIVRAQAEAGRQGPTVAPPVSHGVRSGLFRHGLPTRDDYLSLRRQVTELEEQIDRITAERGAAR